MGEILRGRDRRLGLRLLSPAVRKRLGGVSKDGRIEHYFTFNAYDDLACSSVLSDRPFKICGKTIKEGQPYVRFEQYRKIPMRPAEILYCVLCPSCAERHKKAGKAPFNLYAARATHAIL